MRSNKEAAKERVLVRRRNLKWSGDNGRKGCWLGGGGLAQRLDIRLFAFGSAYWPLASLGGRVMRLKHA